MLCNGLYLITRRIEFFLLKAHLFQILAVSSLFHRFTGKPRHDVTNLVPLVQAYIMKGIQILHNKGNDITSTTSIMTEVRLAGLVLRMPDDNRVGMSSPFIHHNHLQVLAHPSLTVDTIA